MTNRKKEVAKFLSGFVAFHTVFHAYLFITGTAFTAFGVTATPNLSLTATLLNGAIAVVLGVYAWKS